MLKIVKYKVIISILLTCTFIGISTVRSNSAEQDSAQDEVWTYEVESEKKDLFSKAEKAIEQAKKENKYLAIYFYRGNRDYRNVTKIIEKAKKKWSKKSNFIDIEINKLILGGMLDTDTIEKIGKITGVDAIIVGSIVDYSPKRVFKIPIEIIERGGERLNYYYDPKRKSTVPIKVREADRESRTVDIHTIEAAVSFNLRMVDVETGSIVWGGSYSYDSLDMNHAIAQVADKILDSLPRK